MSQLPIFFAFLLLAFIPCSTFLTSSFNFPSFSNAQKVRLYGDAFVNADRNIDLTITHRTKKITRSNGWAVYANPITIYDARAGFMVDFQSSFSFEILPLIAKCAGDGIAFFMAPANWTHNAGNGGPGLGIFNESSGANNRQIVAVEFDTYINENLDPLTGSHMGIDIASIHSTAYSELNFSESLNATAHINYNSATGNLSSHLKKWNDILGFSGSTGAFSEVHRIVSWNFSVTAPSQSPASAPNPISNIAVSNWPQSPMANIAVSNWRQSPTGMQNKTVDILVACLVPLIIVVAVIIIIFMRKRKIEKVELKEEEEEEVQTDDFADMTMNFETGPRKFRYEELAAATNDFSDESLGKGGLVVCTVVS